MTPTARIDRQLVRTFEGNAWHGPAVLELLSDVSAEEAGRRPIPGAHTIQELVLHIRAWEEVARRRLDGELVELDPAQDFPAGGAGGDAAAWSEIRQSLEDAHRRLRERVRRLDPGRWDEKAPGREHTLYDMVHGIIQHGLYHAGQIALLKKALRSG